jgi:hypothetical protein
MTVAFPATLGSEVVFLAAGPPTATDDVSTQGAREGNRWHDQTADEWWICSSATTGAAVWQSTIAPALNSTGRNKFHNPMFNVQQRGVGPFSGNGVYTFDRWTLVRVNDTVSISVGAVTDPARAAIGDEDVNQVLLDTFTGSATAGSYHNVCQRIEYLRRLSGKTITVSFWALSSASQKVGVSIDQNFGIGGSATVVGAGQAVTLTTAWARYSVTFSVPSVSGKTVGTGDFLAVSFWLSAEAINAVQSGSIGVQSGSVQLWGMQMEIGSAATALEKPDRSYDLGNCQRFYMTFSAYVPVTTSPATLVLPTTMRAAPFVSGGGAGFVTTGATASAAAVTVGQTTGAAQTLTFSADL